MHLPPTTGLELVAVLTDVRPIVWKTSTIKTILQRDKLAVKPSFHRVILSGWPTQRSGCFLAFFVVLVHDPGAY